MAVKVHWGDSEPYTAPHSGSWVGGAPGTVHVKWGGSTWTNPSFMNFKWGGWVDSGYRGYAAVPVGVHVNYWDYNEVRIGWSAGGGGAPVAAWQVVQTDQWGNWLRQYEFGGSPSPPGYFPVSHSTYYRFYVRSKSVGGLYSEWAPSVGTYIGKPAVSTTTPTNGTRPWSQAANVSGYKDQPVGVWTPTSVRVTAIRYQCYASNGFTSVLSPYGSRTINRWVLSSDGPTFSWGNNIDVTVAHNYWSDGGVSGFVCRGSGWSTTATTTYRCLGTITVSGMENYVYNVTDTVPAVGNSYW